METYGIVLAGGGGERFWPLSRRETPKQLLNLSGKEIMLNEAIERLSLVCAQRNIFVVTSARQTRPVQEATASRLTKEQIISEPAARNTAACIGLAAMKILKERGDGILIVTPSDAYIKDSAAFAMALKKAIEAVKETNFLVTIGISPTFPATGYGYIRYEKGDREVKRVEQFVEKPDIARAERFLAQGNYVWNSGMFLFKASAILEAFKEFAPDIYELLAKIGESMGSEQEKQTLEEIYPQIRSISIDYAVMEKSKKILVVPGEFGWSDVGSLDMLSALYEKDGNGNVISSDFVGIEAKDCVVYSKKRLIAAVGVENLVIVETPEAILVCDKARAQEVKKIVEELRRRGREDLL